MQHTANSRPVQQRHAVVSQLFIEPAVFLFLVYTELHRETRGIYGLNGNLLKFKMK